MKEELTGLFVFFFLAVGLVFAWVIGGFVMGLVEELAEILGINSSSISLVLLAASYCGFMSIVRSRQH